MLVKQNKGVFPFFEIPPMPSLFGEILVISEWVFYHFVPSTNFILKKVKCRFISEYCLTSIII